MRNDIIFSVDGRSFESVEHFHSWYRLTRKPGTTVEIDVMRNGQRRTVELPVIE